MIAPRFIRLIFTIEFPIAPLYTSNAMLIVAPELGFRAISRLATGFIRPVPAVVIVVAAPSARDALVIRALEVSGIARVELGFAARVRLVLARRAVGVPVALPRLRDAPSRAAPEQIRGAASGRAVGVLVRTVFAVVVHVAHPDRGYALAVVALELVRGALCGWAVGLVLAQRTVNVFVATLVGGNAARRNRAVAFAPELRF